MSSLAATTPRLSAAPRQRLGLSASLLLPLWLAICVLAGAIWLEHLTRPVGNYPRNLTEPLWTICLAILSNASCAILGCYLVLRRMSLLGDAISHAVLPGIVIGYLFSGELQGVPIILGAMSIGILTSVLTQTVASLGKVSEDASMGVVFTSLFALGVILINVFAGRAHIDADCVLYGAIEYAAIDLPPTGYLPIPRSFWILGGTFLATLAFILVLWKELKIVSFDPALAAAMGIAVTTVHYALMAMVAGVSVAAFESVGSILVVAMLIVPAAAAKLMTDRLRSMIAWAVAIGTVSAIFGYLLAAQFSTNVAGSMAVVAGLQLALAVFFSPRHGLVSQWIRNLRLAVRIAGEDILARLYRAEEIVPDKNLREPHASRLVRWLARIMLRRRMQIKAPGGDVQLTDKGRGAARNLIRAHRLWEVYLDTHFDLPRDHLHDAAERMEHFLDDQLREDLATELADRQLDPHGKQIPPKDKAETL